MKHILISLMVALAAGSNAQATSHVAFSQADTATVATQKTEVAAQKTAAATQKTAAAPKKSIDDNMNATIDKAKKQLAKDRAELANTRKQLDKQRKALEEDLDEDELALFSDTTSTDTSDTSGVSVFDDDDDEPYDSEFEMYNPVHFSNPISFFMALLSTGTGAFIAISILILLLLFFILPFIVVILILRYLFRRSSNKQNKQQQAFYAQPHMATVQPQGANEQPQGANEQPQGTIEQPQGASTQQAEPYLQTPVGNQSHTDETIRSGIKTTFIGLGLFCMFAIWDSEGLMGIGVLVLFIGLGKLAIGYMAKKDQEKQNKNHFGER